MKKFSIFYALLAAFVFIAPAAFAQLIITAPNQGVPDHTVNCDCEQVAIATPGSYTAPAGTTMDMLTNVWITSHSNGNATVFANSAHAACKVLPGTFLSYQWPTEPYNYPLTIECHTDLVVAQTSITIQACTPMGKCETLDVPLNITPSTAH
ncbi:hypothetical protein ABH945_005721 [Paraburkholderia sp. GAS333]|uniref:hypothetical protein n=1 Tax=Paraburkholderia sp. GAS333 TaxID=3156279 RepID=UPI003D227797